MKETAGDSNIHGLMPEERIQYYRRELRSITPPRNYRETVLLNVYLTLIHQAAHEQQALTGNPLDPITGAELVAFVDGMDEVDLRSSGRKAPAGRAARPSETPRAGAGKAPPRDLFFYLHRFGHWLTDRIPIETSDGLDHLSAVRHHPQR